MTYFSIFLRTYVKIIKYAWVCANSFSYNCTSYYGGDSFYGITHENSLLKEITNKGNDATSSAKVATASSETSKKIDQPVTTSQPTSKPKVSSTPVPQTQKTIKTPAIQGKVLTNSGNNPTKGYWMYLRKFKDDGSSEVIAAAASDEKGIYLFENIQPGKYQTSPGPANTVSGDLYITITSDTKIAQGLTVQSPAFDPPSYVPSSTSVKIDSISPNTAKFGDTITIKGSGFGSSGQYVVFTNPSGFTSGAAIISWNDTEIKANIPPTKGENKIQVEGPGGVKSNSYSIQVTSGQPYFKSIGPAGVKPGGEITVDGDEFGSDKGSINFYQSGNSSSSSGGSVIYFWSNTQIKANVPGILAPGQEYGVQVVTSDNRQSSFKYYTVGN